MMSGYPTPGVGLGHFDKSSAGSLREVPGPITMQQPSGPGFRLDGQTVSRQNEAHAAVDAEMETPFRTSFFSMNGNYLLDGGKQRIGAEWFRDIPVHP
jgi:hypothetical protein